MVGLTCFGALSCSAPSPGNSAQNAAEPAQRRVTGWGPFDFDMSFDEAVVALPGLEWNPVSLHDCREDMAIEGCLLVSGEEHQLPLLDGIAFRPDLRFDRRGRLSEVSLSYAREANVTSDQCLGVLDQAVDGVAKTYGGLSDLPSSTAQQDQRDGFNQIRRRTPEGNDYTIGQRSRDGVYVSSLLRSHRPAALPQESRAAVSEWDKVSNVSILSSFIWVDRRPYCSINVTYHLGSEVRSGRQHETRRGW